MDLTTWWNRVTAVCQNHFGNRYILYIVCVLLLQGCSVFDDEPVLPSTATFSLTATEQVNPNLSGEATPLELQIFELEDDSMFLAADYEALVDDAEKALKSNYIDHRDFMLVPGQFKFVERFELDSDTHFIGVMGRYAEPEQAQWKKVIKVKPKDKVYHLMVLLEGNEVKLNKVE